MQQVEEEYRLGESVETHGTFRGTGQNVWVHYIPKRGGYNSAYAAYVALCGQRIYHASEDDREFYRKYSRCQACCTIAAEKKELTDA